LRPTGPSAYRIVAATAGVSVQPCHCEAASIKKYFKMRILLSRHAVDVALLQYHFGQIYFLRSAIESLARRWFKMFPLDVSEGDPTCDRGIYVGNPRCCKLKFMESLEIGT
jgi:hypothetical protein